MDAEEQKRQVRAREIAARVVGGGKVDPASLVPEPLEGMTNRNYLIKVGDARYVVRIPGEGTEEYIDRQADGQAARITSEIGVNAPVVYYVENSRTFRTPGVCDDPKALARAAQAFHRLHTSGKKFLNRFDEKIVAAEYMDVLRKKGARLPDGYERV